MQFLGLATIGASTFLALTLIVAPTIDQNKALEAENQALKAEIDTLEQRYIDQLLRSQKND